MAVLEATTLQNGYKTIQQLDAILEQHSLLSLDELFFHSEFGIVRQIGMYIL
jgi:hypothetical protein